MTDESTGAGAHRSRPSGPSRRWFLIGGAGAVVVGGAGGVAAELTRSRPAPPPPSPPTRTAPPVASPVLVAAVRAERALIARLDAALATAPVNSALLKHLRSEHAAHEQALLGAITAAVGAGPVEPVPSRGGSNSPPAPPIPTPAQLRSAEQGAATQAATRAGQLTGAAATLLASIAASEATHAEVLS